MLCISHPGGAKITWLGMNAPIEIENEGRRDDREEKGTHERKYGSRNLRMSEKGWTGSTWPGKHAGSPFTANKGKIRFYLSKS